jgi:hypothetical protein
MLLLTILLCSAASAAIGALHHQDAVIVRRGSKIKVDIINLGRAERSLTIQARRDGGRA